MKLISLVEYSINTAEHNSGGNNPDLIISDLIKIYKYALFLSLPLELGMFIPCVDNKPFEYSLHGNETDYKNAMDKVLFTGFEIKKNHYGLAVHLDNLFHSFWKKEDSDVWTPSLGLDTIESMLNKGRIEIEPLTFELLINSLPSPINH